MNAIHMTNNASASWKSQDQWNQLLYYVPSTSKDRKSQSISFGKNGNTFYAPSQVVYCPEMAVSQFGKDKAGLKILRLKDRLEALESQLLSVKSDDNLVENRPLIESLEYKIELAGIELDLWLSAFSKVWGGTV